MQDNFLKIGLVGFGSVGKDTVARYLSDKHQFTHISSGDLVRDYIRKNNLGELTRENLQKVANELRSKNGADYLTVLSLTTFTENKNGEKLVISGLRAIPEVTKLKEEGGKIIAVVAPVETRYAWATRRGGATDHVTFEQFKATEEKEAAGNQKEQQNIKAVLELADITIINDGSRDDLYRKIDEALSHI